MDLATSMTCRNLVRGTSSERGDNKEVSVGNILQTGRRVNLKLSIDAQ